MSNVKKRHFDGSSARGSWSTAQTNTVIYTPTSGHSVRLLGYIISTDTAQTITLKLGTRTLAIFYLAATSGANMSSPEGFAYGTADETLNITTSTTGNAAISAWGYED